MLTWLLTVQFTQNGAMTPTSWAKAIRAFVLGLWGSNSIQIASLHGGLCGGILANVVRLLVIFQADSSTRFAM